VFLANPAAQRSQVNNIHNLLSHDLAIPKDSRSSAALELNVYYKWRIILHHLH